MQSIVIVKVLVVSACWLAMICYVNEHVASIICNTVFHLWILMQSNKIR